MRLRDFGFTWVLQYFAGRLTSNRPQRRYETVGRLFLRHIQSMMTPRRWDSRIAIWRGVSDEKLWKAAPTLELSNVGGADCSKNQEVRHAKT